MTEKNNNLTIIKKENVLGNDFTIYGDIDNPLFLAKDVAAMIEHSNVSSMLKSVDEDEKVINNVYTLGGSQESWFLTEYGLYEVLMQSRKPIAKEFKSRVKEILRDLRRTGCVITESATTEAIDYQSKYGKYRIRKTFTNTKDPRKTYEEFIELSKVEYKAGRVTGEDRIKASKIIIDSLEQKVADNISDMRGSELLAIQELLTDINKDLRILCNRRNGGKLAAKTKELNILNNYLPDINEGYLIEKAPFSENYMYESKMFSKDLVKTSAYKKWISNLHLEQYLPKTLDNVDFTEPLSIWIYYGCMDKFDIANLGKAIIDQIAKYYNFDDKQVVEFHPILNEYVSSYQESYMFVCIKNV